MKLNIGCGQTILKGFINIDKYFDFDIGIINDCACLRIDIEKEKLTDYFNIDSVEEILLSHVLEHLVNPYTQMLECHKILKKDGILIVKLPSFNCNISHLRYYHREEYLDDLTKVDETYRSLQINPKFTKIYVRSKKRTFKEMVYKIYNLCKSIFFVREYEYKLKKN